MKKRYFLVALLLMLTFLTCCAVALAEDDVPPPEQISVDPNFSMVDWYLNVMPLADELKLVRTTANIYKTDSTHVAVRGVTQTNKTCLYINGYMAIQQWKDNRWNTYTTVSYTNYGANEATGETIVAVASGYYYRLAINHYAFDSDGNTVSSTVATASILVN